MSPYPYGQTGFDVHSSTTYPNAKHQLYYDLGDGHGASSSHGHHHTYAHAAAGSLNNLGGASTSHNHPHSRTPIRPRIAVACVCCRKRKVRCDGKEPDACSLCKRLGRDCKYVPVPKEDNDKNRERKRESKARKEQEAVKDQGRAYEPVRAHHPYQISGRDGYDAGSRYHARSMIDVSGSGRAIGPNGYSWSQPSLTTSALQTHTSASGSYNVWNNPSFDFNAVAEGTSRLSLEAPPPLPQLRSEVYDYQPRRQSTEQPHWRLEPRYDAPIASGLTTAAATTPTPSPTDATFRPQPLQDATFRYQTDSFRPQSQSFRPSTLSVALDALCAPAAAQPQASVTSHLSTPASTVSSLGGTEGVAEYPAELLHAGTAGEGVVGRASTHLGWRASGDEAVAGTAVAGLHREQVVVNPSVGFPIAGPDSANVDAQRPRLRRHPHYQPVQTQPSVSPAARSVGSFDAMTSPPFTSETSLPTLDSAASSETSSPDVPIKPLLDERAGLGDYVGDWAGKGCAGGQQHVMPQLHFAQQMGHQGGQHGFTRHPQGYQQ
ncbi:Zn(2)-C6 fungal-type DNA-binding domain protein [Kalmanozyma brasiliensis GHG001]|uniref:Zn(2)-C6 fungal-type DNA-binding domain protein n=1 Tax=Kalmanozyma brasiliensis (strain GHG001) TaxID=1365824 RepID=UPI002867FD66|nr:Zn(2)-C6 fungal-type DNA-binding domain protein [Kalmanozyma brasiliensis GHG001]KAF6767467.1 Zn(2)-C6 fungal-type DNA-binding domain protein [Kalmanozyma brasiliensis GHG001]